MNTKKLMLAAGIIFQLSGSLFADNWSDAFLAFGGGSDVAAAAQAVKASPNTITHSNALKMVGRNATPEALAVARYLAKGNKNLFHSALSDADVRAAADALSNAAPVVAPASAPTRAQAPVSAPVKQAQVPVAVPAQAASNNGSSWFGGWSSSAPVDSAAVQKAIAEQQKRDVQKAAEGVQAIANIANSGAEGAALYNGYVDLILGSLQEAISAIADPAVQQQVKLYAQGKLSNMKVSASQKSPTLGRYTSKHKSNKKGKNK